MRVDVVSSLQRRDIQGPLYVQGAGVSGCRVSSTLSQSTPYIDRPGSTRCHWPCVRPSHSTVRSSERNSTCKLSWPGWECGLERDCGMWGKKTAKSWAIIWKGNLLSKVVLRSGFSYSLLRKTCYELTGQGRPPQG